MGAYEYQAEGAYVHVHVNMCLQSVLLQWYTKVALQKMMT
jgi:hypothetical protein